MAAAQRRGAWFWIVAGVNGAGKSTLASRATTLRRNVGADALWLDPDERARTIRAADPSVERDVVDALAILQVEAEVDACIENGRACVVETVLSSQKYRARLVAARKRGMRTGMIYVALSTVELAIMRVRDRVALGGHDVPEEKQRARWARSRANVVALMPYLDVLLVYCNDRAREEPVLVAQKRGDDLRVQNDVLLPDLVQSLMGQHR